MRLKKIPEGARFIKFENPFEKDCMIFVNKKWFLFLGARSFSLIEPQTFYIGFPMEKFPAMQPYCKLKIGVSYVL